MGGNVGKMLGGGIKGNIDGAGCITGGFRVTCTNGISGICGVRGSCIRDGTFFGLTPFPGVVV